MKGQPAVLSRTDHDYTPDAMWLFNPDHNNVSNNPLASVYDATLNPGPVYPTGAAPQAVTFDGVPNTHIS